MRNILQTLCIGTLLVLKSGWAQDSPRGHWTGTIDMPNQAMGVEIDIDNPANKGWVGTMALPAANQSGVPLENIALANGKWTFHIKAPGEPVFAAILAADGKTMAGDFTAGGNAFPFKVTRSGDPKIETPKPSPAVAPQFTGTWEGTLDVGAATLRLKLNISNGTDGAKALLTSLDQGNSEIPVTSVEQVGTKLNLKVAMIGGEYRAEINKDASELTGTWTQGPGSFPLSMKKVK